MQFNEHLRHFARFQLTLRVARSLGDRASCFSCGPYMLRMIIMHVQCMCSSDAHTIIISLIRTNAACTKYIIPIKDDTVAEN